MKTSLKTILAASLWCATASIPARAQTQIPAPRGWTTQTKTKGATTFTPPDLRAGEKYSVTVYDAAPLNGQTLEAYLRKFAGPVGSEPGQLLAALKMGEGNAQVASATGFYARPNRAQLFAAFTAFSFDGGHSVAVARTLTSSDAVFNRYVSSYKEILGATAGRAKAAKEAHYKDENIALDKILSARNEQNSASQPSPIPKVTGPLMPASLGGARVFVKYYWSNYPTLKLNIGHLLLFPDGTAFDAIPSEPLGSWSAAQIRKSVPRFDIGSWKAAGNTMVLSFPQRQRNRQRTLTRNPRGWNDPSEMAMDGDNTNIYFPVTAPPRARLLGVWNNENLSTAGTMGGAAPLVAGGSSSGLNLRADGTFAGNSQSFFSATTSNMGDAYKGEGDVFAGGQSQNQSRGKWRLDGPLLTLEKNGERTVHLAFLLPYWGKNPANTDLMIDDDRWERPKK